MSGVLPGEPRSAHSSGVGQWAGGFWGNTESWFGRTELEDLGHLLGTIPNGHKTLGEADPTDAMWCQADEKVPGAAKGREEFVDDVREGGHLPIWAPGPVPQEGRGKASEDRLLPWRALWLRQDREQMPLERSAESVGVTAGGRCWCPGCCFLRQPQWGTSRTEIGVPFVGARLPALAGRC